MATLTVLTSVLGAPEWTSYPGGGATKCSHGEPFTFFVRPGDPSRLVVELEGGGCCFSAVTCALPEYLPSIGPVELKRLELEARGGIGDHTNPSNPVANWTHLFIPYCTGDAHNGNRTASYGVHHFGRVNAHAALEWAYANMPQPKQVLTTGTSAGAVGSYILAPHIMDHYTDTKHYHFADSYAPMFGQKGYNDGLRNWDLMGAYSRHIPLAPALVAPWRPLVNAYAMNLTALAYPAARFSSYVSHTDAVEAAFYLVEGCGLDGCDWPSAMRDAFAAIAAPNFAHFIGPGSSHGAMQSSDFYRQASKGRKLIDWVADLLSDRPVKSIDCKPHCGILAWDVGIEGRAGAEGAVAEM